MQIERVQVPKNHLVFRPIAQWLRGSRLKPCQVWVRLPLGRHYVLRYTRESL